MNEKLRQTDGGFISASLSLRTLEKAYCLQLLRPPFDILGLIIFSVMVTGNFVPINCDLYAALKVRKF